ncbi:hypothetical protein FB451DRAFT_700901 [Mycena latifolia]|nr:hypothetical protein FB451DRAFT_700901 [Mycena latifolia]
MVVAVGQCDAARRRHRQRQGKCTARDAGATRRRRKVAWMRLSNPDARLSIPVRDTAILHALVLVSASSRGVLGGKRHGGRRARRGIGFRMLGRRGIGGRWPGCGLVPAGPPSIHPSARRVLPNAAGARKVFSTGNSAAGGSKNVWRPRDAGATGFRREETARPSSAVE